MDRIPSAIINTFNRLKKEHRNLVLVSKNSHYYVYENHSYWDKNLKRTGALTKYLGKINDDGTFMERQRSYPKPLEKAKRLIESAGGKVILPEELLDLETGIKDADWESLTDFDKKILKALSMDARAKPGVINKFVDSTPQTVYRRIKLLEEKFGIKYILELNTNRLGYIDLLAFIKFYGEVPPPKEIKNAFEKEPHIQFCATLKGEYDLLLYIIADKDLEETDALLDRIIKKALTSYTLTWHIKIVLEPYNFIPIRELFFEALKKKVWVRSKDNPRPKPGNLKMKEYLILKELNKNSTAKFRHIDIKYNLDYGNSRYSYFELMTKGVINRPTINLTKLPIKYEAIINMAVLQRNDFEKTRNYYRYDVITDTKYMINKYCLLYSMRDPNGVFLIMPVVEQGSLENTISKLENKVKGVKLTTSIITSILIGDLCYRVFDNTKAPIYTRFLESGGIPDITRKN
ncbi:MAG: Lrp/AsnC family transcriptional regulator [Candidatus Micrarchaeota archaeon]|nr:Lrp/AsnC family transcriptional regulator [Candidatus Micrarchaeota archaeon]MDE1847628.1 Lrp/AsnC family transcriptional regulator [Candidatus Micrarchaeota archaeon]MDE1863831.1 Lrp/AsnC family transcriptional regulator [Candidatus Micrarchaeota archaeon]